MNGNPLQPTPFTVNFCGNRPMATRRQRPRPSRNHNPVGARNNPVPGRHLIYGGPTSVIPRRHTLEPSPFAPNFFDPVRARIQAVVDEPDSQALIQSILDRDEERRQRRRAAIDARVMVDIPPPQPYVRPLGGTHVVQRQRTDQEPSSDSSDDQDETDEVAQALIARHGSRIHRVHPLTRTDLWIGGTIPDKLVATKAFHKCSICNAVKSHPVSYRCGHSHCYVCIRLWLEDDWCCPICDATMYSAPFRHLFEEAALASAYPEQNDGSVDYSWSGLTFPKEPAVLVPESP
ncbi:hypothetical protein B0H13DRAFT_2342607 [Mycena leptocephala]|nr:hypothetical protein B0H13DRAFT_2342607 [Mycena leptocephala]